MKIELIINSITCLSAIWMIGVSIYSLTRSKTVSLNSYVLLIPVISFFITQFVRLLKIQMENSDIVGLILLLSLVVFVIYMLVNFRGLIIFSYKTRALKDELFNHFKLEGYEYEEKKNAIKVELPKGGISIIMNHFMDTIIIRKKSYKRLTGSIIDLLEKNNRINIDFRFLYLLVGGLIVFILDMMYFFK